MAVARYTAESPCPICSGHARMPQGQGIRCFGYVGTDGWCLCTREGSGTRAKYYEEASGWSHRIEGRCPCGTTHAEESGALPPARAQRQPARQAAEVREIGEARRAEIVATYDYVSSEGELLYQVVRFAPKTFLQRRPHPTRSDAWVWHLTSCADFNASRAKQGKRPCDCGLEAQPTTLYRIPQLVAGLQAGDTLWICEGEKDVEAVEAAGGVATTNSGGAGKWRDELSAGIARHAQPGGVVRVVQDIDPEFSPDGKPNHRGQRHARAVYDSLRAALPETVDVSIVQAAAGKDAADHLAAGLGLEAFVRVWPEPAVPLTLAEWKRGVLRGALTITETALEVACTTDEPEHPPRFVSPLKGVRALDHLQGVVTIAGGPSAGKSYFAIGAAIDNALHPTEPWDVFYLSCEMGRDYVLDRALRACASNSLSGHECMSPERRREAVGWIPSITLPENFTLVEVGIGVSIEEIIEYLAGAVTDRPTLVILDSISSLVDNMSEVDGDSFGMTNLRAVQRYAVAVRRLTRGHVAWIILSELNREGRAKGRSLDHRSDIAIAMSKDPDQGLVKKVVVSKSWYCADGSLGDFTIQPDVARLVRIDA